MYTFLIKSKFAQPLWHIRKSSISQNVLETPELTNVLKHTENVYPCFGMHASKLHTRDSSVNPQEIS
jgi:hypothetical protein